MLITSQTYGSEGRGDFNCARGDAEGEEHGLLRGEDGDRALVLDLAVDVHNAVLAVGGRAQGPNNELLLEGVPGEGRPVVLGVRVTCQAEDEKGNTYTTKKQVVKRIDESNQESDHLPPVCSLA